MFLMNLLDLIIRGLLLLFLMSAFIIGIAAGWIFQKETIRYYRNKKRERTYAN